MDIKRWVILVTIGATFLALYQAANAAAPAGTTENYFVMAYAEEKD